MKKSIKSLISKIQETETGMIKGGFGSIKGGAQSLFKTSNKTVCSNTGISCSGTNEASCSNSGTDCSHATNSGTCTNTASWCAF